MPTPIGTDVTRTGTVRLPGAIRPGAFDLVNMLTGWATGQQGGIGNLYNPLLAAMLPGEDIQRQRLQDQYRAAGQQASGAFAQGAQNFENQLALGHGALASKLLMDIFQGVPSYRESDQQTLVPSNFGQIAGALGPLLSSLILNPPSWLQQLLGGGQQGGAGGGQPTAGSIPGNFPLSGALGGIGALGNIPAGADLQDFLSTISPSDFYDLVSSGALPMSDIFGSLDVPNIGDSLSNILNPDFGLGGVDFSNLDFGSNLGGLGDLNLGDVDFSLPDLNFDFPEFDFGSLGNFDWGSLFG